MDDRRVFNDQMLSATFEFARLALSSAILINGGAAAALVAFLADRNTPIAIGMYDAVLRFAIGAGVGGAAAMIAYFAQRMDWEVAARPPGHPRITTALVLSASAAGVASYVLFFCGCLAAAQALRRACASI